MTVGGSGKRGFADVEGNADALDDLVVTPLGAGREVGRSCHILKYKGFTIMLDCGIHPGLEGGHRLPYFGIIDLTEVDIVLITHFHLDHCGALPYLLQKTVFKGKVFMTRETRDIYRWNLIDQVRVSALNSSVDELYSEEDVKNSLDKITTVSFKQSTTINGLTFTPYCAGHVLGACMYEIEIAGVRILYTGDYSREADRHLMAAEIPPHSPDVLLVESTFGTRTHENREDREKRFVTKVHQVVREKGGKCLIPAFALGRVQELLLILDEYWERNKELQDIPIYYASALARRCLEVYQDHVKKFHLRHINYIRNIEEFNRNQPEVEPCVVFASPGMLQSGMSRVLFERWAGNSSNAVILAGFSVEGTLAKQLMSNPKEVETMTGRPIKVACDVNVISFVAHVDAKQNFDFISAVSPTHIILVHGQEHEMMRLKQTLSRKFESIYTPRNTNAVSFHYRGEKMAKIMGSLVENATRMGAKNAKISGVFVSKNFNHMIVAPSELGKYTNLQTAVVKQKQAIPFEYSLDLLSNMIATTHGIETVRETRTVPCQARDITRGDGPKSSSSSSSSNNVGEGVKAEETLPDDAGEEGGGVSGKQEQKHEQEQEHEESSGKEAHAVGDKEEADTKGEDEDDAKSQDDIWNHDDAVLSEIEVMGCVVCRVDADKRELLLEWVSSPEADMWADAILAMVMQISARPVAIKMAAAQLIAAKEEKHKVVVARSLYKLLSDQFGKQCVRREENSVVVTPNAVVEGRIHLSSMSVTCEDAALRRRLLLSVNRLRATTSL